MALRGSFDVCAPALPKGSRAAVLPLLVGIKLDGLGSDDKEEFTI